MTTVQVKLYNQLVDMDYAEFLRLWYHKLYGAYGGAYGIYAGHVDGSPDVLGGSWAHLWYDDGEEGLFAAIDHEELASLVLEMKLAVTTLKEMHAAMVAALATLRGLPAPQNDREYYSLYDNLERAYCVATDNRRQPSWLADQNYRKMTLNMLDLVLQMKEIVARFGSKILKLSDKICREEVFDASWESMTFRALPPLWEIASREELLELEDSYEVEPEQRIDDIVDLTQEGMLEPQKAIVFLEEVMALAYDDGLKAKVQFALGRQHEIAGNPIGAIRCYSNIIENMEASSIVHYWRGQQYLSLGDLEQARQDLENAIRIGLDSQDQAEAMEQLQKIDRLSIE